MKVPLLSPPAARRYVQFLHSRFGVPESVIKGWVWAQYGENVFVLTPELRDVITSHANIFSVGIQAFADAKTFQPTSNFLTLLGAHIRQNMVALTPEQAESFFAQKKLSREHVLPVRVLSEGWVAVAVEGQVVGSASLTRNHLIPNLPGFGHAPAPE